MHSSGSGFSPLPKQSRAPPTLSHPRHPQAPRLVSQIYFGRFFRETEMKHLPPAPWFEVQGVPCFKSNGRSSSAITEARRPVLLSRDDPQGREARFSHNGETRPKGSSHRRVVLVTHGKEGRGNSSSSPRKLQFDFFVEKLVKLAWRGGK